MSEERFCSNGWRRVPAAGGTYKMVGKRKVWVCKTCSEGKLNKDNTKRKKPVDRYSESVIAYLGSIR